MIIDLRSRFDYIEPANQEGTMTDEAITEIGTGVLLVFVTCIGGFAVGLALSVFAFVML